MKKFKNNLIAISGKKGSGKDEVASIIKYLSWRRMYEENSREGANLTSKFPDISLKHYESYKNSLTMGRSIWKTVKYADKLKDIVCLLIGCTREELENREYKETPLPPSWSKWDIYAEGTEGRSIHIERCDDQQEADALLAEFPGGRKEEIKLTPRIFLQLLGTEGGRRVIHENVWVNATFATFQENPEDKGYAHHALSELPVGAPDKKALAYIEENHIAMPHWLITDCRFPNEADAVLDRQGFVIRVDRPGSHDGDQHESETALDNYTKFTATIINDGTIMDLIGKIEVHFGIARKIDGADGDAQ